ncbi:MAG: hypothetical protein HOH07_03465 [Euryarchaeota archaeon]|jgi:hypothetical protein|nr:hypothetical protein [Euryarchaeota archaeon]
MTNQLQADMTPQVNDLVENIKTDYYRWTKQSSGSSPAGELGSINQKMIGEFNEGIDYKVGKKYVKVMTQNSVWGFVVNVDDDKMFRKGDILKAAGYNAPARNKPRGNILDGGYQIRWTGPLYL